MKNEPKIVYINPEGSTWMANYPADDCTCGPFVALTEYAQMKAKLAKLEKQLVPKPKEPAIEFPANLATKEFQSYWQEWEAYRRSIRKPLTPQARKVQLRNCEQWGKALAMQAIRDAIDRNWITLYTPRENSQNHCASSFGKTLDAQKADLITRINVCVDDAERDDLMQQLHDLKAKP